MRFKRAAQALACAGVLLAATSVAMAQDSDHQVITIWPGAAPGTTWSGAETAISLPIMGTKEMTPGLGNVTTPTLTVYRPAPGKANGDAMIVCPGGGFMVLSWEVEGTDVAKWLAARGITAFVLKYRVHMGNALPTLPMPEEMKTNRALAVADGVQAIHYLRANAATFGITPDHVGIMGFSAGAMLSLGTAMDAEPADRPNLVGSIYGMMDDKPVTKDMPPVFIAAAANDELIPIKKSLETFTAWHDAGASAELHVYQKGGHGFGIYPHQTTSDNWTEDFEVWLRAQDWITAQNGQ